MPEAYTGSEGTAAAAKGWDVLDGLEDRRDGWRSDNKTRDLVATHTHTGVYVEHGGSPGILTISFGAGRAQLFMGGAFQGFIAYTADIPGAPDLSSRVAKSGDTMTGQLYLPNSFAASSGYTVAYINSDGRVSRGASSERYKFISAIDPDTLGDIFPEFHRFKMRADGIAPADNTWRYGYIAEHLIGTDAEPFVVVIDGQVESIDFIGLLLAQVAQLHQRDQERQQEVDDLRQRIEALEGGQS